MIHSHISFFFVCFGPHKQFFSYLTAVTITSDRSANLDLCLALTAFSSEGSFTCHTSAIPNVREFLVSIELSSDISKILLMSRLKYQFWYKKKIKIKTRCVIKHKCPRTRQIPEEAIVIKNPRSRFQNLRLQYKGLVTRNMHMKYKSLSLTIQKI
jgi:hypothetical protein